MKYIPVLPVAIVLAFILLLAMTSCADLRKALGGVKVGVCYEDTCVNVEIPKTSVVESGKEVTPVQ